MPAQRPRSPVLDADERLTLLADAQDAVEGARETRARVRRRFKKGHPTRESLVGGALVRLAGVMEPVRREMGRAQYALPRDAPYFRKLALVSREAQREKRKLWKLRAT